MLLGKELYLNQRCAVGIDPSLCMRRNLCPHSPPSLIMVYLDPSSLQV